MIRNALAGKPLPVYGDGRNVRDWLYVTDHCEALRVVLAKGEPGETYNIGGESERANNEVVQTLCALLDKARPRKNGSHPRPLPLFTDPPRAEPRHAMETPRNRRQPGRLA